jgi:hypothetical protein
MDRRPAAESTRRVWNPMEPECRYRIMVSGNGTSVWPLGGRMARILHETLLLCSMAAFVVGVVIAAASLLG